MSIDVRSRVTLLAILTTGCVHVRHDVQVQPFGTYQSDLDLQERATEIPDAEAEAITAYIGELPPGFEVQGDRVVPPVGAEVLGAVSTNYTFQGAWTSWMFGGFYRMQDHQKSLQTYCNVQAPLVWVTLTLWNYLPARYPCIPTLGNGTKAVAQRKDDIVQALRRGAAALGGNVLVVTALGDIEYVEIGTDRVLGGMEMTQGSGVVIRMGPDEPQR